MSFIAGANRLVPEALALRFRLLLCESDGPARATILLIRLADGFAFSEAEIVKGPPCQALGDVFSWVDR